jgi:hypothetical protein
MMRWEDRLRDWLGVAGTRATHGAPATVDMDTAAPARMAARGGRLRAVGLLGKDDHAIVRSALCGNACYWSTMLDAPG